ncbi:sensor histidine kinase [Desulforamulus aeronauticus]|uniref:histidine kinase n=1 Tax=Desulforamulus aeronauticus DSM 10349 TaxID=1121421 RepID=A0A1M6QBH7_9FIRM|nr:Signal transduction histidine kinase [Desulforamulus aeronauticus DSM 10349]
MQKKNILGLFRKKSLTNQIVIIITAIMLVPLVALVYDIFFASRTDEVFFLDKEQRLKSLVESTNDEFTKSLTKLDLAPTEITPDMLHNLFTRTVEPLLPANSGFRFGLYIPNNEKITVLGFVHNYRNLSPAEEAKRQEEIFANTKTSLLATEISKKPLFRITGSWDDQVMEYISPVVLQGKLVGVMWAGERLNPIFYQSSYFRKLVRYFILAVLVLGIIGTLLVVRNITTSVGRLKSELQKLENDIDHRLPEISGELGEIAQAVNKMAVGLSQKEALEQQLLRSEHLIALGRLATGVAHELRNPIGIIKTLVELMKQEYSQVSGINEFTAALDEQVDRQNLVIQELLNFGRPTKVAIKECSINDNIKGVLSFSAAMLRKQKITVHLRLADFLPPLLADVEKLKQVFVNLIINAVEAMPDGGRLVIATACENHNLIISFTDTGIGMTPEEMTHIFDPFYTSKPQGTGLGLAISYQNIKLHNGSLEVNSSPQQGTTFTIKIPIEQNTSEGGDMVGTTYSNH